MLSQCCRDIDLMNSIQGDLDSINTLISDTLNISLELTQETKKSANIVDEINSTVAVLITPQSTIKLTLPASNNCSEILYPMAFKRILTNLITNAIRYGKGEIQVVLDCNNAQTSVHIDDNGPGIPEEYGEKIFRPFYRLEKSRNSDTGGSGLELAIVRQLANSHNWIATLSPRKNGGTRATVVIKL